MKGLASTVLLGALVVGFAGSAEAFDNERAAIALHIAPANSYTGTQICHPPLTAPTLVVQVPTVTVDNEVGPFYWTYMLACNGSDSTGLAGMEFGIQYPPSIVIYGNTNCTYGYESTGWPASGGGTLIVWASGPNCQNVLSEPGVPHTVIGFGGYFYMAVYAPSQMSITPRPNSGFAKVADCSSREDDLTGLVPSRLGMAGFGGLPGYNPCVSPVTVTPSTWSGIKNLGGR